MTEHNEAPPLESEEGGTLQRRGSMAAMVGGVIAGYGTLAAIAIRYLYPARPPERRWMYVARLAAMAKDETIVYRTPIGETVNITRKGNSGEASDFVALSSVCPHLGCQVHWEAEKERYFCPCHNGVFDADGVGTAGPPGEAGQSLSRYELKVADGLLYIKVSLVGLAAREAERTCGEIVEMPPTRPGHDPCLAQLPAARRGRQV